jgi:hypothetical protein
MPDKIGYNMPGGSRVEIITRQLKVYEANMAMGEGSGSCYRSGLKVLR